MMLFRYFKVFCLLTVWTAVSFRGLDPLLGHHFLNSHYLAAGRRSTMRGLDMS